MVFSGSSGEELAIIPCPFRLATDLECPGCGMTRSCLSLVRGDFAAAWHLNPFSFLLVGLAVAVPALALRVQRTSAHVLAAAPTGGAARARATFLFLLRDKALEHVHWDTRGRRFGAGSVRRLAV